MATKDFMKGIGENKLNEEYDYSDKEILKLGGFLKLKRAKDRRAQDCHY